MLNTVNVTGNQKKTHILNYFQQKYYNFMILYLINPIRKTNKPVKSNNSLITEDRKKFNILLKNLL